MRVETIDYPCASCGAYSVFNPDAGALECPFCQTQGTIESREPLTPSDYQGAYGGFTAGDSKELKCHKCGVDVVFDEDTLSSYCSHCKTALITQPSRPIHPHGIVPFVIGQKRAAELFKIWIGTRWFAPNALSQYAQEDKKLAGHYFPFWNYHSKTTTRYTGQRGVRYTETVTELVTRDGVAHQEQVQKQRIDWTQVSGVVQVDFKDIAIEATRRFNPKLLRELSPWGMSQFKGFDTAYLSGFETNEYTVGIDEAFKSAAAIMGQTIEQKIKADIGGDEQRIEDKSIHYDTLLYQATLYPVYTASFRWKEKLYEYAINGITGEVVGSRPYSYIKIATLVVGVIAVSAALYFLFKK